MKQDSYVQDQTPATMPQLTYEHDFTNKGQFEKEEDGGRINLMTQIWPGIYKNEIWVKVDNTDFESYSIVIYYYNQYRVLVNFDAYYGQSLELQPAWDFVKETAKKFFLKNKLLTQKDAEEIFTWEEVEAAVAQGIIDNDGQRIPSAGNTWYKFMTVEEAKELFRYLKISVDFPS